MSWGRSLLTQHRRGAQLTGPQTLSGLQKKNKCGIGLLSSQEGAAQGDHAKQDLEQLLHHVDLPPQVILSLLTVSVHSNVDTLVDLLRKRKATTRLICLDV